MSRALNNTTLAKITPNGSISTFATGLSYPIGMTFDAGGTLFVSNAGTNNSIVKITTGGVVSPFVSGAGEPDDIRWASDGFMYVADNLNRIDRITPGGTASVLIGCESICFATPVFLAEVPEPASGWFICLGAGALVWLRAVRGNRLMVARKSPL